MSTASIFKQRRQAFASFLPANTVALFPAAKELRRSRDTEFLFRQDSDFWYLTGFNEPDAWLILLKDENDVVSEHLLCREKDKQAEIWQGRRLGPEQAALDFNLDSAASIENLEKKLFEFIKNKQHLYWIFGEYDDVDQTISSVLKQIRAQTKVLTAPAELKDARSIIHEMRLFKSSGELAIMTRSCQIACQAHKRAMLFCQPGVYEYQLEAEILHEFAMHGARSAAYGTIVAGGDNANILHYTENQDPLIDGDLVLIDAGCELEGYAADITRTFPVNGRFSKEQALLYQLVLDAQTAALNVLKAGVSIVDAANKTIACICQGLIDLGILTGTCEDAIKNKSYRQYFMHGLGHWLGLDVHDVGDYKIDGKERLLEPGMVMTVEPGIYIAHGSDTDPRWQGIGIRIEDNIVITESGFDNLTQNIVKEIADIEALMAKSK